METGLHRWKNGWEQKFTGVTETTLDFSVGFIASLVYLCCTLACASLTMAFATRDIEVGVADNCTYTAILLLHHRVLIHQVVAQHPTTVLAALHRLYPFLGHLYCLLVLFHAQDSHLMMPVEGHYCTTWV